MANAVEEALNRANEQKRESAENTIATAQHTIDSAKMQSGNTPSNELAAIVANNEQIIAEARRSIPTETMKSVDSIGPPMNTLPTNGNVNSEPIELNPQFSSQIESIEQGSGNNYLNQNAVDRAMARPAQDSQTFDQQQSIER